jgi:hypothetical protein
MEEEVLLAGESFLSPDAVGLRAKLMEAAKTGAMDGVLELLTRLFTLRVATSSTPERERSAVQMLCKLLSIAAIRRRNARASTAQLTMIRGEKDSLSPAVLDVTALLAKATAAKPTGS